MKLENIIDVRRYLNKFGYYIYTGDPLGDLDMMKEEIFELFESKIIEKEDFIQLVKIITQEQKKWTVDQGREKL